MFGSLREETEVERVSIDWVKELNFWEEKGMKEDEEIVVGNIGDKEQNKESFFSHQLNQMIELAYLGLGNIY